MKYNILVTAIGSFSADCVISTLKKKGHAVIGCDIYPSEWHAVSKDCDAVYQAPLATHETEYIHFLLETAQKHQIQYIFPLTDIEIDVLNKNRELFSQRNILICMSSQETLSIARDKYELYKHFLDDPIVHSIPTYLGKDIHIPNSILPAVAKPYNGRSSEGLMHLYTLEDLQKAQQRENYIIQKLIPGSIFTVDYVRQNDTGNDFAVPREELLRTKNGAGTTIRIINDPELNSLVSHIGKSISINGCINMEFIKNRDQYYLIDINPRFSAGVAFSKVAGDDMITNHLNCFTGKAIESPVSIQEKIVTKRYKEEVL